MHDEEGFVVRTYADLVSLFVELRGKGTTLARADLLVLKDWETKGLPVETIAEAMLLHFERCEDQSRPFPQSLKVLEQQLRKCPPGGEGRIL